MDSKLDIISESISEAYAEFDSWMGGLKDDNGEFFVSGNGDNPKPADLDKRRRDFYRKLESLNVIVLDSVNSGVYYTVINNFSGFSMVDYAEDDFEVTCYLGWPGVTRGDGTTKITWADVKWFQDVLTYRLEGIAGGVNVYSRSVIREDTGSSSQDVPQRAFGVSLLLTWSGG